MRIDIIKKYIEHFSETPRGELLEKLKEDSFLDSNEKNAVYLWYNPLLIGDRELPEKIGQVKVEGSAPSDQEIVVLIGAYHSAQYGNFIRHLLHAFTDPTKVFPYSGKLEEKGCSICGTVLHPVGESEGKVSVAYGSEESSVHLCMQCLLNLQALHAVLMIIEGEDYLNRYKR